MKLFITFCVLSLTSQYVSGAWTYEEAAAWRNIFPACGGRAQTPVNIEKDNVKCERTSLTIRYLNSEIESVKLKNGGHDFKILITFKDKTPRLISWVDGAGRKTDYAFHSAHYHWGPQCTGGSEHTIDGHRADAELHIIHVNTKYKTLEEALPHTDGLAVLGVMLEVAEESLYNTTHAQRFVQYLPNIAAEGDEYTLPFFNSYRTILDLIKYDVKDFYTYQGSLTTPPCSESVRWLVSTKPIRLYQSELAAFQAIFPNNYRPLQPLNGRIISGSCL